MPQRRWCVAAGAGAGSQLGTCGPASCGHPKCREIATCVHDLEHCEPPDGKRGHSTVPGCGGKSQAVRGSLADRIKKGGKRFCRVTTRRRNIWFWKGLGRGLGLLAARSFCHGMLGFDLGGLATFGLATRRQPAVDLPQAFRILAVALVPALRLVLATASPTQASARARVTRSGFRAVLCFNVVGAHGRYFSQGKCSGRMSHHSPRALSK
jgi:hypothetical protein